MAIHHPPFCTRCTPERRCPVFLAMEAEEEEIFAEARAEDAARQRQWTPGTPEHERRVAYESQFSYATQTGWDANGRTYRFDDPAKDFS